MTVQADVTAAAQVQAMKEKVTVQNYPNPAAYVSGKMGMDGVLRVLAREIGEQQSTVNQVAFLATDLSGFISGAFFPLSGGTVMTAI